MASLPFAKRRRLIKLFNLKFELGKQAGREYVDIIWYGELQGSYFVNDDLGEELQPL